MKKARVYFVFTAKVLISGLLLWLILRKLDVYAIGLCLRAVDLKKVLFALLLAWIGLLLAALRWRIISGKLLSFWIALKYTWIGLFYGAILPGGISGDIVKGVSLALANSHMRASHLPLSIVLDRIVGLFALLIFFITGCALITWGDSNSPPELRHWTFNGFLLGSAALFSSLLLFTKITRRFVLALVKRVPIVGALITSPHALQAVLRDLSRPKLLMNGLALSCVIHSLSVVQYLLVARALHLDISLAAATALYSILSMVVLIPISISGIGVRDGVSLLFFASFGLPKESAIAFSWLQLMLGLVMVAGGGIIHVSDMFRREGLREPSVSQPACNRRQR